jgi:hypothetical protein
MYSYTAIFTGFITAITAYCDIYLFILKLFGIHFFIIRKDTDKVRGAMDIIIKETICSSNIYQRGAISNNGTFIGLNCFGRFSGSQGDDIDHEIYIYTTKSYFNRLIETATTTYSSFSRIDSSSLENEESVKSIVPIWGRSGTYMSLWYSSINLDVRGLHAISTQSSIVYDIVNLFYKKKRLSVFLHGVVGAGKSTIGLLVAKEIKGGFCHTFNPTDPGDTLHSLMKESRAQHKPLVVVIEEADMMIRNIHTNSIQRHKNIQTSVYNKSTFNTFLDDLMLYRNIIIILTSNKSKDEIDMLDTSYLRKGRIDATYSMLEELEISV